jgi:hypothetical protein
MDNADFVGTTLIEQISGANGVASGTPSSVVGQVNQARSFNGSTDYFTATQESLFDFEVSDPFSVSFWFKTATVSNDVIFAKWNFSVDPGWVVSMRPTGELFIEILNAAVSQDLATETDASFNDDIWHHGLVTYDGSSDASGQTWYVDGVAVPTTIVANLAPSTILNNNSLQLGATLSVGSPALHWDGELDEMAVWNRELTANEALEVYRRGAQGLKLVE